MDPIAILAIGLVVAVLVYSLTANRKDSSQPVPDHLNTGAVVNTDLWYGYFGCFDGQIAASKDHVNVLHIMDWCNYKDPAGIKWMMEKQAAWMKEAKANGITKIILTVGYLTFTQVGERLYKYKGSIDELAAFKDWLGPLASMVVALYLIDEPDWNIVPEDDLRMAAKVIKSVWNLPLAVIYGDHGTPAKDAFDIIGMDKYGAGAGVLGQMPELRPGQRYAIVPGGADPWRQDPQPFLTYAKAYAEVAWLCPFLWGNYGNPMQKGIFTNGMADAYRKAGKEAISQKTAL